MLTTWAYPHPDDARLQLSPTPEPIPTYDAALAVMELAKDFYDDVKVTRYVTLDGPDGTVRSSFAGAKIARDSLVWHHRGNVETAGYITN